MTRILLLTVAALVGLGTASSIAQAGYSHYFTWRRPPDPETLVHCVADMRRLVQASPTLAQEVSLDKSGIARQATIAFNGISDELMHEDFIFPGRIGFNFCKTSGKPYDAVVTACLLAARDHFPPEVLEIQSDGNWEQGDWEDGAELYCRLLGRPARNPITPGPSSYSPFRTRQPVPDWVSWATKLVFVGLLIAGGIWLFRPKFDFTITANDAGIQFSGQVPHAKRRTIVLFFVREFERERHVRVAGRWGSRDRRLHLRCRGVSPGEQQRIRNFLLTVF
jgi:hypothetical protein